MERIGRGGMATVFRGYQESIDRSVAVKVLPAELLHDPNFLTRFLNEARTLARLSHPSILPLYDFGEANGMPFIVMPLMKGTLAERLQQGALPLAEVVRVITPVAQALDFAHQQGVLHRDVKPNNVLFDQHENPYLADFGIAKAMESATSLTGTGIIGTPDYMSPEQARGDMMDGRSDVYSLGVVAYQMLTGQMVFRATTPMGVIFKHASEPPRPLRDLRPEVPEAVERVVLKALEKDPNLRYQTGAEFARALSESVAQGSGASYVPPTARADPLPTEVAGPSSAPVSAPASEPAWGTSQSRAAPTGAMPIGAAPPAQKRGGLTGWLIGGAVGLVAVCGLGGCAIFFGGLLFSGGDATPTAVIAQATPTERPEPSATRRPTQTPAPEVTPTPRALSTPVEQTSDGEVYRDAFSDNANDWPVGEASDEYSTDNQEVADGVYRWQVQAKQDFFGSVWSTDVTYADFRLTADLRQVSGPSDSTYGFVFRRVDSDNYYNFALADTGEYALFRRTPDGWVTVVDWTDAEAIQPGQVNRVTVEAQGTQFTFSVNDETIGDVDDSDGLTEAGYIGFGISANADTEAIFEFDNLEAGPLYEIVFFDDFNSSDSEDDWPIEVFTNERVIAVPSVEDGKYHVDVTALDGVVYRSKPDMDEVDDFILSVTMLDLGSAPDVNFGVVFREEDDEYYYAPLNNDGQLRFLRWSDGDWTTILEWTDAPSFRANQVNHLEVEAVGGHFVFRLNGEFVAEADDDGLSSGVAGIAIELSDIGDVAVFEFDDFLVRAP
jgi:serine/threonine-protein kinase